MVKKLYANYFTWTRDDAQFDVRAGATENILTLFFQPTGVIGGTSFDEGSMMPTSGLFVGMIIFVTTNTNTVSTITFKVQAREPGSGDWKILGFIDIPPGEIGCFYSDPDTSDFTREYAEYSMLKVSTEGSGGSTSKKIDKVTVMIGLETEVGRTSL